MTKKYVTPEIEFVTFENNDIIMVESGLPQLEKGGVINDHDFGNATFFDGYYVEY